MSFYLWPPIKVPRNVSDTMQSHGGGVKQQQQLSYMSITVNPQMIDHFYTRAIDLWTTVMHTLWRTQCAQGSGSGTSADVVH